MGSQLSPAQRLAVCGGSRRCPWAGVGALRTALQLRVAFRAASELLGLWVEPAGVPCSCSHVLVEHPASAGIKLLPASLLAHGCAGATFLLTSLMPDVFAHLVGAAGPWLLCVAAVLRASVSPCAGRHALPTEIGCMPVASTFPRRSPSTQGTAWPGTHHCFPDITACHVAVAAAVQSEEIKFKQEAKTRLVVDLALRAADQGMRKGG